MISGAQRKLPSGPTLSRQLWTCGANGREIRFASGMLSAATDSNSRLEPEEPPLKVKP